MMNYAVLNQSKSERRTYVDRMDTEKQLSRYASECGEVKVSYIEPQKKVSKSA